MFEQKELYYFTAEEKHFLKGSFQIHKREELQKLKLF
tara:strand:- start:228 stop:338 length:111 start_codon:yes stop_codon:yes gene_type:complete